MTGAWGIWKFGPARGNTCIVISSRIRYLTGLVEFNRTFILKFGMMNHIVGSGCVLNQNEVCIVIVVCQDNNASAYKELPCI